MEEEFRYVVEAKPFYVVGNSGTIINLKNKIKPLKHQLKKDGYYYCKIFYTMFLVSRIVAHAFPDICGEWFEGCEVHHCNGDKSDNRACNLRVVSKEEHLRIHNCSEQNDKIKAVA